MVQAEYAEIHATPEPESAIETVDRDGQHKRKSKTYFHRGLHWHLHANERQRIHLLRLFRGSVSRRNYLGKLLTQVSFNTRKFQKHIKLANTWWGFLDWTRACFAVLRFRHHPTYLASTLSMCLALTALTICATEYKVTYSRAPGKTMPAMIFLFSPVQHRNQCIDT